MAELYRRNPKIEESPLQGELMLFDPVKSQFFVLNPTMAYVWKNCDGDMSLERIVGAVPAQFSDSERHPVAADMKTALDELVALGLVTAD